MPDIGFPELLVILVIALVLFGGGKLPEVGRSLGQAIREFKNAMRDADPTKDIKDLKDSLKDSVKTDVKPEAAKLEAKAPDKDGPHA
ncbi:MAG: Sec-independent protein translocase subunit TatA/TatB [bacterium]